MVAMTDKDKPTDTVILSIRLASGRFETSLKVPLLGDPGERDTALGQWADLVKMAFATGATAVDATFATAEKISRGTVAARK